MNSIQMTFPMVVNACFGGFGMSAKAEWELARRKGFKCRDEKGSPFIERSWNRPSDLVKRNDEALVAIVREMGEEANGPCADLRVVDVTIGVDIADRDGKESVLVHGGAY